MLDKQTIGATPALVSIELYGVASIFNLYADEKLDVEPGMILANVRWA